MGWGGTEEREEERIVDSAMTLYSTQVVAVQTKLYCTVLNMKIVLYM